MSLATVTQLYTDLGKLAQKFPERFTEPAMVTIFNANLADAKAQNSDDAVLAAVPEANGQVRINDLFIRAGQLKATLESIACSEPRLMGGL